MKTFTTLLGALGLLTLGTGARGMELAQTLSSQPAPSTLPVQKLNFRERLTLKSEDDLNSISLGGRFQLDNDFYDGAYNVRGNGGSSENEIRRARLGVDGRIDGDWVYAFALNVDDDAQTADVDTASLQYTGSPYATLSLGRFKRPVGMEVLTSSKWLLTKERALIFDAIPHQNTAQFGLMVDRAFGPFHAYLGVFDANVEDIQSDEDQYGLYGRATYARVSERGNVLHLGVSAADQNPDDRTPTTIASRFGVHTLPSDQFQFVNELNPNRTRSAVIEVNQDRQAGLELAAVLGPVTVQSEVLARDVRLSAGREVQVRGGYVTVAFALTGERRRYNLADGSFGNILSSGYEKGGAWELVAKLDHVEARKDADAKVSMATLGLSWTPNLNLKFMLNYLRFKSDGLAAGDSFQDQGSAVNTRVQFHF